MRLLQLSLLRQSPEAAAVAVALAEEDVAAATTPDSKRHVASLQMQTHSRNSTWHHPQMVPRLQLGALRQSPAAVAAAAALAEEDAAAASALAAARRQQHGTDNDGGHELRSCCR